MTRHDRAATALHRPRQTGRAGRPPRRRGRSLWTKVGAIGMLALAVISGREGFDPLGARDWFAGNALPLRAAMAVSAGRADCRVARVIDGDTVDLECPGQRLGQRPGQHPGHQQVRTRLLGFDTPEVFSPACPSELARGTAATEALARKVRASREVGVAFAGTDHYGRRLARLSLDGRDVARSMIADGLARPYDGGPRRSWCG